MLIDTIVSHPYSDLVVLMTFFGALSFVTFLRGLLTGLPHLFTINVHAEHLEHSRVYVVWGVLLLAWLFMLWEGIRVVTAFFEGQVLPGNLTVICSVLGLVGLAILASMFIPTKKAAGSGGH
ncbi:MAG TPA: hypothetical protein VG934_02370 [Candidatus Paceibacterota bacterium]|nr:hypothetical protein [Candidatus Paceibacterota bacterium]